MSKWGNGFDEIGWNELEPIPSVRLRGANATQDGWTGADLSQNYEMLHDGIVNTIMDENAYSIIFTDLNNNEYSINTPTVHGNATNTWCFYLPKGYKIRYNRNNSSDFMSIQYYLKRD